MEKEAAVKLILNVIKTLKPQVRATEEEHKEINEAIALLEEKKDGQPN